MRTLTTKYRLFQHTAARRRLVPCGCRGGAQDSVSTHSRPKAAGRRVFGLRDCRTVSTHSRPKAAGKAASMVGVSGIVSTHSRPKAAGLLNVYYNPDIGVSTHSRPKAAGYLFYNITPQRVFQHTAARRRLARCFEIQGNILKFQHTAARRRLVAGDGDVELLAVVSTHSRPKAAGFQSLTRLKARGVSTHSRPKAAGAMMVFKTVNAMFQHTAARRRLVGYKLLTGLGQKVSTHSRPKAAGLDQCLYRTEYQGFNTQPPEGGWTLTCAVLQLSQCFNTQPPEGGWVRPSRSMSNRILVSTHSRPKAAGSLFQTAIQFKTCFNTQPPEGGWPR